MLLTVLGCLALVAIFCLTWRRWPQFALGLLFGTLLALPFAAILPTPTIDTLPIWLPPLPLALIAATLLAFGIAAWRIGTRR